MHTLAKNTNKLSPKYIKQMIKARKDGKYRKNEKSLETHAKGAV
jgi:hypothetical protein